MSLWQYVLNYRVPNAEGSQWVPDADIANYDTCS